MKITEEVRHTIRLEMSKTDLLMIFQQNADITGISLIAVDVR